MGIKEVIKKQTILIVPPESERKLLEAKTHELISILKTNISKKKILAEVFIGGSFAKNTLIKKDKYDVDVFVRFNKNYPEEKLSNLLASILPKNAVRIHGSRDYFILKYPESKIELEIIPTIKIKAPEEAKNITDLSFFHVNYVKNKLLKNKNLADEIRVAKAFIHYGDCYGAESYVNGFSGYAVELLIISYGSFTKFIEAINKSDGEKIILDPARFFKKKQDILRLLNESKLKSPIILIDPTYKERNALAALSVDTLLRFKEYSRNFLKNPSNNFFEPKDKEQILAKKYGKNLVKIELLTKKQPGDIAGTKLKKFYGFFIKELGRWLDVLDSEFIYDENKNIGKMLLAVKEKKEIIYSGPPVNMKEPLKLFKREHKKIKIIKGKAYASEKSISFDEFLKNFLNEKSGVIESMDIDDIMVIN